MSKKSLFSIIGIVIVILIACLLFFFIYQDYLKDKLIKEKEIEENNKIQQEFIRKTTPKDIKPLTSQEAQKLIEKTTPKDIKPLTSQEVQKLIEKTTPNK